MDQTQTPPPSGEQDPSAGDAWREVGRQFEELGASLAAAFRIAWESEDNRRRMDQMKEGIQAMADEISQAISTSASSPEVQEARQHAEKAAESARQAGQQVFEDIQPNLVAALRQVDAELKKMIDRMEADAAPSQEDVSPEARE